MRERVQFDEAAGLSGDSMAGLEEAMKLPKTDSIRSWPSSGTPTTLRTSPTSWSRSANGCSRAGRTLPSRFL